MCNAAFIPFWVTFSSIVMSEIHTKTITILGHKKSKFTVSCKIPKILLYMNLGITRLRGRPRNRWQDEVRGDGRTVGGEGWQEKVHNREEWKKLLRMAIITFCTCQWNERTNEWNVLLSHIHRKQISFLARQAEISKIKTQYIYIIVYLITVTPMHPCQRSLVCL